LGVWSKTQVLSARAYWDTTKGFPSSLKAETHWYMIVTASRIPVPLPIAPENQNVSQTIPFKFLTHEVGSDRKRTNAKTSESGGSRNVTVQFFYHRRLALNLFVTSYFECGCSVLLLSWAYFDVILHNSFSSKLYLNLSLFELRSQTPQKVSTQCGFQIFL
jgi:hypothetical protein